MYISCLPCIWLSINKKVKNKTGKKKIIFIKASKNKIKMDFELISKKIHDFSSDLNQQLERVTSCKTVDQNVFFY